MKRLGIIVSLVGLCVLFVVVSRCYKKAGRKDVLNELVFGNTEWTASFSHSRFIQVSKGDKQEDVRRLIGKPLIVSHTFSTGEDNWHYTRPNGKNGTTENEDWSDASWTYRTICFTNGCVSQIKSGFWMPVELQ